MKKSKLCTLLMALALSCGALPVQAEEADTDSAGKSPVVKTPLSRTFDPSQISEAYLEWTEHPEGVRPSIMDLSYLSENYAEQYKKQHSGRTVKTELLEAFDLRDQGKHSILRIRAFTPSAGVSLQTSLPLLCLGIRNPDCVFPHFTLPGLD